MTIELPHPVTSASLHPFLRDRFIAGSALDPWVRVYDLDTGKEKEMYKGHHGPVLCASYSPDGEVYASGSEDGMSPASRQLPVDNHEVEGADMMCVGTIRLWQTNPGKSYGLWQTSE